MTVTRSPWRLTSLTPSGRHAQPLVVQRRRRHEADLLPALAPEASAAGVSIASMRPWCRSATRSQSRSASSMKWVTSSDRDAACRGPTRSASRSPAGRCGSRPVVSSSRIASCGWPISASAIDSRCFWPPDRLGEARVALVGQPEQRQQLGGVGRIGVERGEQLQRLADAQLVGQLRGLQLDPDALAQLVAVAARRRGRAPRSCPRRASAGRRCTRPWSSCRRRWARGSRRSRRAGSQRDPVDRDRRRRSGRAGPAPRRPCRWPVVRSSVSDSCRSGSQAPAPGHIGRAAAVGVRCG